MHAADVRPVVSPYRPALQLVQTPAPPTLNLPSGHIAAVALVDPATHAYPAAQLPLHAADGRPAVAPYVPAGHALHTPAPLKLYCPAGHTTAVAFVDPATHAYPALQLPLHPALDRPPTKPYRPAGQGPLHAAVVNADVKPNKPATQSVQNPAPAMEYLPAGHTTAEALVLPMGQA